jgi:cobalamin synthase
LMMTAGVVFVMIKLDKPALKESMADTFVGTAINLPLVWVVLSLCLMFTQNALIISLAQAGVLTVVAIIRRYCTRMWFKNKEETNVTN